MSLRNISVIVLLLFGVALSTSLNAQTDFTRELYGIPFTDSSEEIRNTFSGGLNNPEFQFIDIDNDGDYDLFYLDSDGTYGWYKNNGDASNPQFELSFDTIPGLKFVNWFFFADIDNDGDFDLFTGGQSNFIEFRRNAGTAASPLFQLEADTLKDDNGDPIFSEFGSNPLLADVDGDGDLDFITGNSVGTVTYYENIGTPSSFNFKFITNFWQDIIIIGRIGNNLHGASSLEFADIDNDGDLDLFWGDFFGKSIYFLRNDGTGTNPNISLTSNVFPVNEDSIWTSGFNMPRLVDIDGDGDLDLFVSVLFDPTVPQTLMFYENQGTASLPDHRRITFNFLKTLDVGIQSIPEFIDIDNDGLPDLFLGSGKNPEGSLHYFKNVGTQNNPAFNLIDSAYFGIRGELSIAPAFGDLDNDGDYDLLIGNFDGTISFYRNTGTPESPVFQFEDKLRKSDSTVIDIGIYARPRLLDVNGNGMPDLYVGRFNGRISMFRNTGTPENFIFEEDTSYFSILDVGDNSAPFLFDYEDRGVFDLFVGNRRGQIHYYKNNGTNNSPVWQLITTDFTGTSYGGDANPVLFDIDNDGDADLFIGNVKGGLYFLRNNLISGIDEEFITSPAEFEINVWPNPFNSSSNIRINTDKQGKLELKVFDILGQVVKEIHSAEIIRGSHIFSWNGTDHFNNSVSTGIYFIRGKLNEYSVTVKAVLIK